MLALYALSLAAYYQHIELKYPGMTLIGRYLGSHAAESGLVFVDAKILGRPIVDEAAGVPPGLTLMAIERADTVASYATPDMKATAFIQAGRWDDFRLGLERLARTIPGFRWTLVETWTALQAEERSILVVTFGR
jgi:hypothetical protein